MNEQCNSPCSDNSEESFYETENPNPNPDSERLYKLKKIETIANILINEYKERKCKREPGLLLERFNSQENANLKRAFERCEFSWFFVILGYEQGKSGQGHAFLVEVNTKMGYASSYDCEYNEDWEEGIKEALSHKLNSEKVVFIPKKCHQRDRDTDCGVIVLMVMEEILSESEPSECYEQHQIDSKREEYDKMYEEYGQLSSDEASIPMETDE